MKRFETVEEFEARGGKIQQIARGVSGEPDAMTNYQRQINKHILNEKVAISKTHYDVDGVSRLLGLSPPTVRKYARTGLLPAGEVIANKRLWPKEEMQQAARERSFKVKAKLNDKRFRGNASHKL
jgi:hypothetical protein